MDLHPLPSTLAVFLVLLAVTSAEAQIRVVTYNTLDKPGTANDLDDLELILSSIADASRNDIAKRPDLIALQEQRTFSASDSTASRIADSLNATFGVDTYTERVLGFGFDRLAVVYDTATLELLQSSQVSTAGPRPTQKTLFQPVGYDSPEAGFYLYNSHLKAGSSGSDASTRALEAEAIRADADQVASNANVIFAGDLNFQSSNEAGFGNYVASGSAQARDPLSLSAWPSRAVAEHLTQSTRTSSLSDGGASGGLDDRFDFQLVNDDLLDGEGLSYIGPTSSGSPAEVEHSHHALGNDGVSYNTRINNTTLVRSVSSDVLNALHDFSDHLPIVADYQLPAVLEALADSVPTTLPLGSPFSVEVTVRNVAAVTSPFGADELDYQVQGLGDLSGGFQGVLPAASPDPAVHTLTLDTSSTGPMSGVIRVSTTSEGAANALVEIPVAFEVVLPGDFNSDGSVDAADYTTWRDGLGSGDFSPADYTVWLENFGRSSESLVELASVPEPAAGASAALLVFLSINLRGARFPLPRCG